MVGHHPFSRLTEALPPASRARIEARQGELRAEMLLHELRQARAMTQKSVGEALNVKQSAVAKLERRTDMYVSNLRSYIEALGGKLNIEAQFPQGSVVITNFSDAGVDRVEAEPPSDPDRTENRRRHRRSHLPFSGLSWAQALANESRARAQPSAGSERRPAQGMPARRDAIRRRRRARTKTS